MEEEILKIILGVPNNFQPSKVVPKTLLPEKAAVKAEPAP